MTNKDHHDALVAIRSKLNRYTGKKYWRSLEELNGDPQFEEFLHREFPSQASEFNDPVGRRRFLKLMGASIALAGFSACTVQPTEKVIPYVRQPEDLVLGKPLFFATGMALNGVATGLLAESHEGRPTKIEGNPEHPGSLGAADLFSQASVLNLYDPDRSQTIMRYGEITSWSAFLGAVRPMMEAQRAMQGAGLRLLTGTLTSPSLADMIRQLQTSMPQMKWHQYEPGGPNNVRLAAQAAFGQPVTPVFAFDQADLILSLDADFLQSHPRNLRYTRDYSSRRVLRDGARTMSRHYQVETFPSNTGAKADHRLPLRQSEMENFARAVASAVGVAGAGGSLSGDVQHFADVVARDLKAHGGRSLVIAGDEQPPVVHMLAFAMNQALGNVGRTVNYVDPIEANPVDQIESIRDLARDIEGGRVQALIILGGNPVYDAPADLNFRDLLQKVDFSVHLSDFNDETSVYCQWHLPEAHYLESWSDARAYDGTVTIAQPLIQPLYQGRTAHEVVGALLGLTDRTPYDMLRDFWSRNRNTFAAWPAAPAPGTATQGPASPQNLPPQSGSPGVPTAAAGSAPQAGAPAAATGDFEKFWRKVVHDGFIPNTAARPRSVTMSGALPAPSQAGGEMEIVFRLDPSVYDGRFANNGWLQELPKPISKITWDNAVHISPATAARLGLETGSVVELDVEGRKVSGPVWVMPGHANDSVTVHLGFGRERCGRVGNGVGFNAYKLRSSSSPWFAFGTLRATGDSYELVSTQEHWVMEGRDVVRSGTLEEYLAEPDYAKHFFHVPKDNETMYPPYDYSKGNKWGMAIDLNACVGCNACVVACQSENNIPVVGKDQVSRGREMHWLRVDRYYEGPAEEPVYHFQPMMCVHCENAPCEVVCPVAATVHSAEGLNDMVYNRCIGTRYCSNNCPYKVRRFNFLLYADFETASLKMLRNPDVTVRSRGVMEKCTYCVQRINQARITAEKEGREVRDGEVVTACQATCPADAIVFGNLNDPNSRVAKLSGEPRGYGLLAELNTRPRTSYLAHVRNPNPELELPLTDGKQAQHG